jgi:hypothetical protein
MTNALLFLTLPFFLIPFCHPERSEGSVIPQGGEETIKVFFFAMTPYLFFKFFLFTPPALGRG